jgi:hypothetical protein
MFDPATPIAADTTATGKRGFRIRGRVDHAVWTKETIGDSSMLSALKTKRARAGLVVIALLALTGAAVAYFTTTGSGTGSAQVGNSSLLTITPTITPGANGLVPGGNATVSFTVNNPGGNQYLNTITLGTVTAYADSGHTNNITGAGSPTKCDTSAFSMSPVTVQQDLPHGSTTLTQTGTLNFADMPTTVQDGCKQAYLTAAFSSN